MARPRPHRRRRLISPGYGMGLAVAALALTVAAVPDMIDGLASLAVRQASATRVLERFEPPPDPSLRPLALLHQGLLARLQEGDRQRLPTAELLPDGSTRYLYQRRPDEPELTIQQIRDLMAAPPSYTMERQAIANLLQVLQKAGVVLMLERPRKGVAAAEWDHAERTMRILPGVLDKGTVEFALVLNHEAIHVAQSCAAGGLRATPRPLGLPAKRSVDVERQVEDPLYAGASRLEKELEREAYANQHWLGIGSQMVSRHCGKRA